MNSDIDHAVQLLNGLLNELRDLRNSADLHTEAAGVPFMSAFTVAEEMPKASVFACEYAYSVSRDILCGYDEPTEDKPQPSCKRRKERGDCPCPPEPLRSIASR